MSRFECHITMNKPNTKEEAKLLFNIAEKYKMKTSWITGDPVIGPGKWFYISGYSTSFEELLENMKTAANEIRSLGLEVIREKIEQIMYDTKTNYFTCGVDCFACLEINY